MHLWLGATRGQGWLHIRLRGLITRWTLLNLRRRWRSRCQVRTVQFRWASQLQGISAEAATLFTKGERR
jgi:hypothetical protein